MSMEIDVMPRVLVVDDEVSMRTTLATFLEDAGYDVRTAADGVEALRMHGDVPADIIITDIVMPEQDGLGLLNAVRRETPATKVIVMSGATFQTDFHFDVAEKLGAVVLHKPVGKAELLATLAQVSGSDENGGAGNG
ncbi:MAG: response regulator [Lentisphaerae bacterium]|nr:response regulator [Lentisphaerota bacterium]